MFALPYYMQWHYIHIVKNLQAGCEEMVGDREKLRSFFNPAPRKAIYVVQIFKKFFVTHHFVGLCNWRNGEEIHRP
jgi:hypothetical protein